MKDKKNRPQAPQPGSLLGTFLTMEELADRLAVSQRTIYRWIRSYGLPSYKFGKTVRFEEKQVAEWMSEFFAGDLQDEEGTNDGEGSTEGEDSSGAARAP